MFQAPRSMKALIGRFGYFIAAVVFAGYAIVTLAGPKGLSAWHEKERQIQSLEKSNAELARRNDQARDRIDRLVNDPAEQDRTVEEQLKMVRPGEKVFVLPEEQKKK
jgi:cell division protein FtsB